METVQIREAKASFSALVAAAEKGQPTLVSRHGHPCAMIVPVADGARLYDAAAYQAGFSLMLGTIALSLLLIVFSKETFCKQTL
ncbi:type II toxin-antitoxin system Phd/YefM family antitoxin [bacterium]|nr:type II toxin-antitoxin system Phd/YefM family antitoxin [bacterium]